MSDSIKLSSVAIDCPDAGRLAAFYADITGGKVTFRHETWATVNGPGGRIDFQTAPGYRPPTWPDPTSSMQMHLDFFVDTWLRPRRACWRPVRRSTTSSRTTTTATSTPTRPGTRSACPPGTTCRPDRRWSSFGVMPIAQFKDLCLDAVDAHRLGEFWGTALGRRLVDHDDGDAQLDGVRPQERIWVNAVPEPKTVKNRVHLDVATDRIGDLEALGASVIRPRDDEIDWTVMTDVEGGEFCAFVRDGMAPGHLLALVVDAVDAESQARWWQGVLEGRVERHRDGWWAVEDVPGTPFDSMLFIEVPEPKTVKNRVHWDLDCDDGAALVRFGAQVLREPDDEIQWRVLADPEGNEFCVFAPKPQL